MLESKISFDIEKNIWIVKPIGDIDIYNSPKFKQDLFELFEKEKADILINGEQIEYIDSTGLGVLISILKKVRDEDKNIIISNLKPNIRKLFDITDLDKVFRIIKE